jgi:hypothetical protein
VEYQKYQVIENRFPLKLKTPSLTTNKQCVRQGLDTYNCW